MGSISRLRATVWGWPPDVSHLSSLPFPTPAVEDVSVFFYALHHPPKYRHDGSLHPQGKEGAATEVEDGSKGG